MDQLWSLPLHHAVGLIKCLAILFHIDGEVCIRGVGNTGCLEVASPKTGSAEAKQGLFCRKASEECCHCAV